MIDEKALRAAFAVNHHPDSEPSLTELAKLRRSIIAYESAKSEEAEGWRDIASAPKERIGLELQTVQLWDGKRVRQGHWDDDRYANKPRPFWAYEGSFGRLSDRQSQPTHWRPLPEPPSAMLSAAGDADD